MSQEAPTSSSSPRGLVVRVIRFGSRIVLGLVVLLVAVSIFRFLVQSKKDAPRSEERNHARIVQVIEVEPVSVTRRWRGYGTARSMQSASISAEVPGVIVNRPPAIEPGASVGEGDLLVQIDPTEYEERLARANETMASLESQLEALSIETESIDESIRLAQTSVDALRWEMQRLEEALEGGGSMPIEIERLRRTLSVAERELEELQRQRNLIPTRRANLRAQLAAEQANARIAQLDLERTTIEAPFDGVLQDVSVEHGERVNVGSLVARLVDLDRIEVPLRVPASAARRIAVGDPVVMSTDAEEDSRWEGEVVRIAPEVDPSTRTITAFVVVEQDGDLMQSEDLLLPGQFVSGYVESGAARDSIIVPRNAITEGRVMVVDDDSRAQPRPVVVSYYTEGRFPQFHRRETQWAVLTQGPPRGASVIVSNLDEISAGTPVDPRPVVDARVGDPIVGTEGVEVGGSVQ